MTDAPTTPMSDDDILAQARDIQAQRQAQANALKAAAATALAATVKKNCFFETLADLTTAHQADTLDLDVAYAVTVLKRISDRFPAG